jgi:hypothetical protein
MVVVNKHFKWHHLLLWIIISIFLIISMLLLDYYSDFNNEQIQNISYFILTFLSSIFFLFTNKFKDKDLLVIKQLWIILLFISMFFIYSFFSSYNV